ncbi:hypothetical protein JOB18_014317 [Solea senegalensis]|uniref:CCHC-type domain-containing protein n=1 Tax=Solea senegalensis TaxID=28829 RepID=A0AAV6QA07_SOLSE|nr:hypothetical protein JOB18_014317 [Solea senegalensis]
MADPPSSDEEGSSASEKHTRVQVHTGKGLKENLHQFITARRSKLRLLTTKSNQIEGLMEDDNNVIHVEQIEVKGYKKLYEEFVELNQSLKLYLREDEIEADQTSWFEPKASCCRDFMERVKTWIEDIQLCENLIMTSVKDITPMDSVSNVSSQISSATSVRRREEANKATLIARAAALKKKRAIALKEVQLRADQEQLEIDTELAALAARLKIYADYDALQQQSSAIAMSQPCQQGDIEGQIRYEASVPSLKHQEREAKSIIGQMFGNLLEFTAAKEKIDITQHAKPEEERGSSFVKNATPVKTERFNRQMSKADTIHPNGAFTKPCLFCERNRTLEECQKMIKSSRKDKFEFLKKSGLCFGCLAKGHASKDCKKRMTCSVC